MTTIEAVLELAADGGFSVYCKDELFSGAGETVEEAKSDMLAQMKFYKEAAQAEEGADGKNGKRPFLTV